MKQMLFTVASLLMLTAIFPSCVAKKKYLAAQARIAQLHQDSMDLYTKNQQLQGKLANSQTSNELAANQLNKSQQELMRLQAMIAQQQKNTEALRQKIADALTGFNAEDLSVTMKNGKVYVVMQERLLFPSGSAEVNPDGKKALSSLATVLNQNPNINVNIEGHTDSIPITKRYQDNWALSVARSTAIARILINDYHVNPASITASGRSKYMPVESNSTESGRAHNRRTEIILEPKLDEIMQLIQGTR